MPRIEIDIPAQLPFRCELDVLISHINSGNHLGNDAVIALLNEARTGRTPDRNRQNRDVAVRLRR